MLTYRFIIVYLLTAVYSFTGNTQCTQTVTAFPYQESFENNTGAWTTGGTASSWAWGTPSKTVINTAGDGTRCWMAGGLTNTNTYSDGEASWLQSPCFDFTNLQYPWLSMKLYWETEQQWDGASFQYSLDNGNSWVTVGNATEKGDCLNKNWFNTPAISALSPLATRLQGWTGNGKLNAGACRGGNGSKGWVQAARTLPELGGEPSVMFRFIFGAGTTCNNYDGFAMDSIHIEEAPPNNAGFSWVCDSTRKVRFINSSELCPSYQWNFGDPGSGTDNTAVHADPVHIFSAPGTYTVSLTASGPGNAPSTITKTLTVVETAATVVKPASCETNSGGVLSATVTGAGTHPFSYNWNSNPVQSTAIAGNLGTGTYTITINGTDFCSIPVSVFLDLDTSCRDIVFPSGFTPNNDGKNDWFGPLGSVAAVSNYRLSIYNRWGERVFYSVNPNEKWNGLSKSERTESAVFSWFCEYQLPGQPKNSKKGTVILIR